MVNEDSSPMVVAKDAVDLSGDVASAVKSSSALWESALGKLPADAQAEIEANGVKLTDLTSIYAEAEKKQKSWEDKQVTFKFRGKERKANEIWATIVQSIGTFRGFFGKLVALDTSGKAALPWAITNLVLRALEYKTEQLETIGGAMSTVVEVIRYYVTFELLYQHEDWLVVKELKSAVIDVYADILRILCLAKAYYTKKASSNPLKHASLLVYTPDMFKRKLQSIEEGNSKVENWARLVRRESEQEVFNRVKDIRTHLRSLAFWADIEYLSSHSSLSDHVNRSRGRIRDTGVWLLKHEEFQSWRHSQRSALLLLTGSVGTGKTMLTSLVIDGFLHDFQTVAKSPVLYFYNTPGQDPEEILRNFVRQLILAQSNPFELFDERFRGGPKLSASDCLGRIESFIRTQDSLAIIIDALDKASPGLRESSYQRHMIPSSYTSLALFRDLVQVMKKSPRPVKVFVSSQCTSEGLRTAFRDLKQDFTNQAFEISTDKQPMDDVIRVVKHEVESWAPGELLPNLHDTAAIKRAPFEVEAIKTSIIEAISRKAQRMFTWAILVLRRRFRDNKELRTVEDVNKELEADQVPQKLEELYDDIFDTLYGSQSSPSSQDSGRVINILFCVKKELSSSAFIEAAAAATHPSFLGETYEQRAHNLISSCLGWVIYDAEGDMFRFQHPSVEQYLHKKSEHSDFGSQAHATMAKACLKIVMGSISRRNSFAEKVGLGSDVDEDERGRSASRHSNSVGSSLQSSSRPTLGVTADIIQSPVVPSSGSKQKRQRMTSRDTSPVPLDNDSDMGDDEDPYSNLLSKTASSTSFDHDIPRRGGENPRQTSHQSQPKKPEIFGIPAYEEQDSQIALNASQQRLDVYIPVPTSESENRLKLRSSIQQLCNAYHLTRSCPNLQCEYDHNPLDEDLILTLKWLARSFPCPRRNKCRNISCTSGHHCQKPDCKLRGGRGFCRFPWSLHYNDLTVDRYVYGLCGNSFGPSGGGFRKRSNSNSSTSSQASQRSESESRPRRRARSTASSDTEADDNGHKARDLVRGSATDSMTNYPIQDFEEYATLYWVSHYQACTGTAAENSQLREYVENILLYGGGHTKYSTISRPNGYFQRWIESIQDFFSRRPLGFYGQQVETELQHCLYPPPSPFRVGCVYGLTLIVKASADSDSSDSDSDGSMRLSRLPKEVLSVLYPPIESIARLRNAENTTGLHLASKFGRVETVQYLGSMDSARRDILGVDQHGKTPLQYAVEAATDTVLVKEILKIPGAKTLRTTSGVLIAAMRNTSCAQDLVRLLLGGRGDTYRRVETKTRDLAVAAISYPFATLDLVKHVTSMRMVDRRLIRAAAASSTGREVHWKQRKGIWKWLLEQWHNLGYSEAGLDSAIDNSAANGDPELLRFLREQAVRRSPGQDCQTFRLILSQRRCLLKLTDVMLHYIRDKVFNAAWCLLAALEHRFVDVALVSKLAQHVNTGAELGRLHLEAIAKNRRHGAALLGNPPKTFHITSNVPALQYALKTAVRDGNAEVIKMFLVHLDSLDLILSEVDQLIHGVVTSPLDGNYLQKYAAIARADLLSVSEAPQTSWDGVIAECLGVFLSKLSLCDGLIQPLAEEIALLRGRKTMEVLLNHPAAHSQNPPLRISRAMMLAAAKNKIFGFELLQFLPQRAAQGDMSLLGEVSVDDEILRTVARHGDVRSLMFLLGSYPLEHYSKGLISAAVENTDSAVAEYVFRRLEPSMVGMDELEKAAATSDSVFDCVLRLYDAGSQQGSARLSAIIAERCRRSKSLLEAFRRGAAQEPTTPEECHQLVLAAVKNMHGVEMASFLLKRYQMTDKRIRMTKKMLKFAARNRSAAPEMLRLLLGQCDDGWVESIITTDVLAAAASNGREGPEALRILLLECKDTQKFASGLARTQVHLGIDLNRDHADEARNVFWKYLEKAKKVNPPA